MKKALHILLIIGSAAITLTSCDDKEDDAPMTIASIEPTSGDYGDYVTIKGSQLATASGSTVVRFGEVEAELDLSSPTELLVIVPVGAETGNITVEVDGKSATSADVFTVTAGNWEAKANFGGTLGASYYRDPSFSIGTTGYVLVSERSLNGVPQESSFWAYNSVNNTWTKKKELSIAFAGQNFVAWGTATKGYVLQEGELWSYDPAGNEWSLMNALPDAFNGTTPMHAFYISGADRAYVILNNGSMLHYNEGPDTWSTDTEELPFAAGLNTSPELRSAQATVTKGYFRSGSDVWQFDPVAGEWTSIASFPALEESDYSFHILDDLYIGSALEDNLWVYKATTDEWKRKAGALPAPRQFPLYFSLGSKGYVGMGDPYNTDVITRQFFEFTP